MCDCSGCQLILASASPRRRDLLQSAGLSFAVIPSSVEESVAAGDSPQGLAESLAEVKVREVGDKNPDCVVIAADTVVALPLEGTPEQGYQILGKPADIDQAFNMLSMLQGTRHVVVTGFSVYCKSKSYLVTKSVETSVWFRELSSEEISAYIATDEPYDKAGAYGIQGIAGLFISRISGSYSNVVGLPLAEVVLELKRCGVWSPPLICSTNR